MIFALTLLVVLWAVALAVLGFVRARKAAVVCHVVALGAVVVLFVLSNVFNASADTKPDALGATMLMLIVLAALGAGLVANGVGSLARSAVDALRGGGSR